MTQPSPSTDHTTSLDITTPRITRSIARLLWTSVHSAQTTFNCILDVRSPNNSACFAESVEWRHKSLGEMIWRNITIKRRRIYIVHVFLPAILTNPSVFSLTDHIRADQDFPNQRRYCEGRENTSCKRKGRRPPLSSIFDLYPIFYKGILGHCEFWFSPGIP